MLHQMHLEKAKADLRAALIGLYAAHAENGDQFNAIAATMEYDHDEHPSDIPHFQASYFIEAGELPVAGGSL